MSPYTTLPRALLAFTFATLFTTTAALESELGINTTTAVSCSRHSKAGDRIAVHYKGSLQSNGFEFDESYKRGAPFVFVLGQGRVIRGWDLGLLDMCPGEERTLTIPPDLGYGKSGSGPIPPGSTLVFETKLMDIVGVKQEFVETVMATPVPTTASETEAMFSIATAPSISEEENLDKLKEVPSADMGELDDLEADVVLDEVSKHKDGDEDEDDGPKHPGKQAKCHLLGPFALIVQAALGAMALLTLVWKRYRETPKRPWKIFFFDVSKQVLGSMLTHVLNLAMSMLSSVAIVDQVSKAAAENPEKYLSADGRMPNPCSFYLLNLGIDTTIGIPVLYVLLQVLHALALRTPLARPPQSIKSGNYGQPPYHTVWWLKQLGIYFIGLVGMKLFVFFLFSALPWLPWVGDWALRWTKGNEALEVTFAMFIFPLAMNAVQYWIIDNFIMEKKGNDESKGDYAVVHSDEDEDGRHGHRGGSEESATEVEDEDDLGKNGPLAEVNPTPIPAYENDNGRSAGTKAAERKAR